MKINLSIVIPCYNEGENMIKLFDLCHKAIGKRNDIEVVFINNGSTDLTSSIIEKLISNSEYSFAKYHNIKNNLGYGNGILKGLSICQGEILSWTHADLQTNPLDVILCFEKYKKGLIDSTCIVKGRRKGRNLFDTFFTAGMALISSFFLGSFLWDINAQPKLFNKSFMNLLRKAPLDFSLDLYLLFIANKNDIQIRDYPVLFNDRMFGVAKGGGTFKGKIKLIQRTLKYILELRKDILDGNR